MSVATQDSMSDQEHFDRAWEERERMRSSLLHAGHAAAGPAAGAAQVRRSAKEMAESLASAQEAVAFGRIDDAEESIYVGKNGILSKERDVLVVNWQAPAAQPYYKATIAKPLGVVRRRTFTTTQNRITNFEDLVFAELAARVEELTEYERVDINDALLEELDRGRTSEMHDIVQTIHHSQYELIQLPAEILLIIQGGPGTGKTAVVLHRVSWLLFNERDLRADEMLVVGPNAAFTQYIKKVLPGLGDGNVQHVPLTQLGPVRSSGRAEHPETGYLKGQARMVDLLSRALRNRARPPAEPIEVATTLGPRRLQAQGIAESMKRLAAVPYASGRNSLRQLIESAVLATPGRPTAAPRSVDAILERLWPALTPARFVQELLGSRDRLIAAAGDEFTAGDIDRLHRQAAGSLGTEEWTDADVALLDEAESLINGSSRGYAHIVVDEAQDLSPMQLRSLARRSSNGSFTISGDIAQSTGPWARDNWDDVIQALKVEEVSERVETLEYGYRVPKEVYAVAQPLLEAIAPDLSAPIVVRRAPRPPEIRWVEPEDVIANAVDEAQLHASKGRFVGVICGEVAISDVAKAFERAEVHAKLVSSGELGQSINLMTAAESKGLEFDAIVVVEPAAIARENSRGPRHLYVALTRTTKYLSVVYSEELAMIGLVPGHSELRSSEDVRVLEPSAGLESPLTEHAPPVGGGVRGAGASLHREQLSSRLRKTVDDYAEAVASEVLETFLPAAHVALLEALAESLGIDLRLARSNSEVDPARSQAGREDDGASGRPSGQQ